jgi:fumarylpyruvate hydrolase
VRALPEIPLDGGAFQGARIFCVGRNYAAHAAEMGNAVPAEPFWFTKSPFHLLPSGVTLPYPPGTSDLHHEVELVLALGEGGRVVGRGVGLDMTRRDLQARAKAEGKPWDAAKDWEGSAVLSPLSSAPLASGAAITLSVNGAVRQSARLSDMVVGEAALLAHLATLWTPQAGDLVMTGTPAGVGAVEPGDLLEGRIEGLEPVGLLIGPVA